jgi:hypothetical protein
LPKQRVYFAALRDAVCHNIFQTGIVDDNEERNMLAADGLQLELRTKKQSAA